MGGGGGGKWLEEADLTVDKVRLVADVIPPSLIAARFFPELKGGLDSATASVEDFGREIEELIEEHGVEGGLLAFALTDSGKLTAASVKSRMRSDYSDAEELTFLEHAAKLIAAEAEAKKTAKKAEEKLTAAILNAYSTLSEQDIRTLVVQDKWLTDIAAAIAKEVESQVEAQIDRVRNLTKRYGKTLPQIMDDLATLEARVSGHLAQMGVA